MYFYCALSFSKLIEFISLRNFLPFKDFSAMPFHNSEFLSPHRLFNDLLMWEPSAPSPVETSPMTYPQIQNNIHVNLESQVGFPANKFFMCRSAIRDGRYLLSVSDYFTVLGFNLNDFHVFSAVKVMIT